MANILEYKNPREVNPYGELGIQPDDRATTARAHAAEGVRKSYTSAGTAIAAEGTSIGGGIQSLGHAAVAYAEDNEKRFGTVGFIGMQDALTKQWNERTKSADPNDPTVAAKFREEVLNPAMAKFSESFMTEGGQKWAQSHTASFGQHMFTTMAADRSRAAGDALVTNINTSKNALVNTVFNNPDMLPKVLGDIDGYIDNFIGSTVSPADASKARTEYARLFKEAAVDGAVRGLIKKNPDAASEIIASGRYAQYISGPEIRRLEAAEKAERRAIAADDRASDIEGRRKMAERVEEVSGGYISQLYDAATGTIQFPKGWASEMHNDPELTTTAKNRLRAIYNDALKGQKGQDRDEVIADLVGRSRSDTPDRYRTTQDEVFSHIGKGITLETGLKINSLLKAKGPDAAEEAKRLADGKAIAEAVLAPRGAFGFMKEEDRIKFARFWSRAQLEYYDGLKAGKSADSMLREDSPGYLFSDARLQAVKAGSGNLLDKFKIQAPGTKEYKGPGQGGNLTGGGSTVTGVTVEDKPAGFTDRYRGYPAYKPYEQPTLSPKQKEAYDFIFGGKK